MLAERGLGPELRGQLSHMGRGLVWLALGEGLDGPLGNRLAHLLTAHWRRLEREGLVMPDPAGLDWLPDFFGASPRDQDLATLRNWALSGGERRPAPRPEEERA